MIQFCCNSISSDFDLPMLTITCMGKVGGFWYTLEIEREIFGQFCLIRLYREMVACLLLLQRASSQFALGGQCIRDDVLAFNRNNSQHEGGHFDFTSLLIEILRDYYANL